MTVVGIITGSGTYALPDLGDPSVIPVETPWGVVEVTSGTVGGVPVLHVSRHGAGHVRLSNTVNHRANIWALKGLGATAVIGCTACGSVDPELKLGSLVIFDDLYFISNRLPDGSLCTFFEAPGDPQRAHWILHGGPFSEGLRLLVAQACASAGLEYVLGGVYGHVDGPRFNTPAEIAALADHSVRAVSQTGGPETILCGELELPFVLVGFLTDHANEVVKGATTPVSELVALMGRSPQAFATMLQGVVPAIAAAPDRVRPAGTVFRFGSA